MSGHISAKLSKAKETSLSGHKIILFTVFAGWTVSSWHSLGGMTLRFWVFERWHSSSMLILWVSVSNLTTGQSPGRINSAEKKTYSGPKTPFNFSDEVPHGGKTEELLTGFLSFHQVNVEELRTLNAFQAFWHIWFFFFFLALGSANICVAKSVCWSRYNGMVSLVLKVKWENVLSLRAFHDIQWITHVKTWPTFHK